MRKRLSLQVEFAASLDLLSRAHRICVLTGNSGHVDQATSRALGADQLSDTNTRDLVQLRDSADLDPICKISVFTLVLVFFFIFVFAWLCGLAWNGASMCLRH